MRRTVLAVLVGVALSAVPSAAAEGDPMTDPIAFCLQAEPDFRKRKACEEDWIRAAEKVVAYAQRQGLMDPDGEMDIVALMKRSFGWRTLLGLPPDDPYLYCAGSEGMLGPYDFRKIWDCIVQRDPEAARMDSI